MLAIFLDTIVLFGILWWFLQNDMPDFKFVFLIAFGLAIINLLLGLFVAPIIGIFALVPSVILTGLVLMFYCHLPLLQAAIGTAVFLGYQVVLYLIMTSG